MRQEDSLYPQLIGSLQAAVARHTHCGGNTLRDRKAASPPSTLTFAVQAGRWHALLLWPAVVMLCSPLSMALTAVCGWTAERGSPSWLQCSLWTGWLSITGYEGGIS